MWIENLRMKKDTFNFVCTELAHVIPKKDTRFRRPISVEAKVAMALWRLATGIDYRSIGQLFGVGRCTCCKITHEVCQTILNVLLNRFIKIVTGERLEEVKQSFLIKSGLPHCVGAVNGCYIHSQKRHRLAASCGIYRLAASCHQVAASLLTSSSCSKSVSIRLAAC